MTQFPRDALWLCRGAPKAQLLKRYRQVFNSEANAAKCFAGARPETDPLVQKNLRLAVITGRARMVIYARANEDRLEI
jgi:hypothetical protein